MVSLKGFVTSPAYLDFLEYVESQIKLNQKSLETARAAEDMYRLQGCIQAYRRLLALKEDVLKKEK